MASSSYLLKSWNIYENGGEGMSIENLIENVDSQIIKIRIKSLDGKRKSNLVL